MADDKNGREAQARNEERRQRERAVANELERGDEPEPPVDPADLGEIEAELESLSFPATGARVVATVGDRTVTAGRTTYTVEQLVPETETETFDSPAAVREHVQRPTVAAAMKRVAEAAESLQDADFRRTQRAAYERTFQELAAIDGVDENEGIEVIADWILDRIDRKGKLPGSRGVRREAAKWCRANGHQVSNDEWLGV